MNVEIADADAANAMLHVVVQFSLKPLDGSNFAGLLPTIPGAQ